MNRRPRQHRKAWRRVVPSAPGYKPPWAIKFRWPENSSNLLTRRAKLYIWSSAILGCIIFLFALHALASWRSEKHLDQFVDRLRVTYNLNDAQLMAIRAIEKEYHGSMGIFSPSRTHIEKREHNLAISKQMSSEAGEQYLADLKSKSPVIGRNVH